MAPPSDHTCCDRRHVRKGLWTPEEDEKLVKFINKYGHGCWSTLPKFAGLKRCGKSCRLRWMNYLRPDLKKGTFTPQEAAVVIQCHKLVGNKWSHISHFVPGRTDNEIKNFWNSGLKKKIVAHEERVQALKKAAAAANFAQYRNVYYLNPNPAIYNHQVSFFNPITKPALVQVYVPAPFEVQAPPPPPLHEFHFLDPPWPIVDNNPEMMTQNNLKLALNDDFVSQFHDPPPPSLNDDNFLTLNQDPQPPPSAVISFIPDLDKIQEFSATENQQGIQLAFGSPEMKVPPRFIDFGTPLPSAAPEQGDEQPLTAAAIESPEMKFPLHHINFIESRMASFMDYAAPSSSLAAATSDHQQLEYHLVAPKAASDFAFRMDPDVATPSTSWDFSEFSQESNY